MTCCLKRGRNEMKRIFKLIQVSLKKNNNSRFLKFLRGSSSLCFLQAGPSQAGGSVHPVVGSSLQPEAPEEQQPLAQQPPAQSGQLGYDGSKRPLRAELLLTSDTLRSRRRAALDSRRSKRDSLKCSIYTFFGGGGGVWAG